jgi:hypothetical protein
MSAFHSMFLVTLPLEHSSRGGGPQQQQQLQGIKAYNENSSVITPIGMTPQQQRAGLEAVFMSLLGEVGVKQNAYCSGVMRKASGEEVIQWTFVAETGEAEFISSKLEDLGIGKSVGSVAVIPVEHSKIFNPVDPNLNATITAEGVVGPGGAQGMFMGLADAIPIMQIAKKLRDTKKNRVAIETVVETVRRACEPTFDFFMFCIISASLCAAGVANDHIIALFASMLVSPLMGPLLAMTFGTAVRDRQLARRGFRTELFGFGLTIVCGIAFGLFWAPLCAENWPATCDHITLGKEYIWMCTIGSWHAVAVGAGIAVPSGVGVALAMLTRNNIALVGVGMSAAIGPPAVNCGVLIAYAITGNQWRENAFNQGVDTGNIAQAAFASFCLTSEFIGIMYLFGILTFKMKDVTPMPKPSDFVGMIL